MEKAFDLKNLGNRVVSRLKKQAVGIADDVLSWTGESCLMSQNAIVKTVGGIVVGVKPVVLQEIEKAVNSPVVVAAAAEPKALDGGTKKA